MLYNGEERTVYSEELPKQELSWRDLKRDDKVTVTDGYGNSARGRVYYRDTYGAGVLFVSGAAIAFNDKESRYKLSDLERKKEWDIKFAVFDGFRTQADTLQDAINNVSEEYRADVVSIKKV